MLKVPKRFAKSAVAQIFFRNFAPNFSKSTNKT